MKQKHEEEKLSEEENNEALVNDNDTVRQRHKGSKMVVTIDNNTLKNNKEPGPGGKEMEKILSSFGQMNLCNANDEEKKPAGSRVDNSDETGLERTYKEEKGDIPIHYIVDLVNKVHLSAPEQLRQHDSEDDRANDSEESDELVERGPSGGVPIQRQNEYNVSGYKHNNLAFTMPDTFPDYSNLALKQEQLNIAGASMCVKRSVNEEEFCIEPQKYTRPQEEQVQYQAFRDGLNNLDDPGKRYPVNTRISVYQNHMSGGVFSEPGLDTLDDLDNIDLSGNWESNIVDNFIDSFTTNDTTTPQTGYPNGQKSNNVLPPVSTLINAESMKYYIQPPVPVQSDDRQPRSVISEEGYTSDLSPDPSPPVNYSNPPSNMSTDSGVCSPMSEDLQLSRSQEKMLNILPKSPYSQQKSPVASDQSRYAQINQAPPLGMGQYYSPPQICQSNPPINTTQELPINQIIPHPIHSFAPPPYNQTPPTYQNVNATSVTKSRPVEQMAPPMNNCIAPLMNGAAPPINCVAHPMSQPPVSGMQNIIISDSNEHVHSTFIDNHLVELDAALNVVLTDLKESNKCTTHSPGYVNNNGKIAANHVKDTIIDKSRVSANNTSAKTVNSIPASQTTALNQTSVKQHIPVDTKLAQAKGQGLRGQQILQQKLQNNVTNQPPPGKVPISKEQKIQTPSTSQNNPQMSTVIFMMAPKPAPRYAEIRPKPIEISTSTPTPTPSSSAKQMPNNPTGSRKAEMDDKQRLNIARRLVAQRETKAILVLDADKDSYLHIAVCRADKFILQALVERMNRENLSHVINWQNTQEQTPLYLAVSTNNTEMVRLLLENNADASLMAQVNTALGGVEKRTALHLACVGGEKYARTLQVLLTAKIGLDVNQLNSEGYSPLQCAILKHNSYGANNEKINSVPAIQLLMTNGADPNLQVQKNGKTALMFALESKDLNLIEEVFKLVEPSKLSTYLVTSDMNGSTCQRIAETLRTSLSPVDQQRLHSCLRPGTIARLV